MNGENNVVTLSGDNGEKIDCEILGTFEANSKEYIAVTPVEGERERAKFLFTATVNIKTANLTCSTSPTTKNLKMRRQSLTVFSTR